MSPSFDRIVSHRPRVHRPAISASASLPPEVSTWGHTAQPTLESTLTHDTHTQACQAQKQTHTLRHTHSITLYRQAPQAGVGRHNTIQYNTVLTRTRAQAATKHQRAAGHTCTKGRSKSEALKASWVRAGSSNRPEAEKPSCANCRHFLRRAALRRLLWI